MKEHVFHLLKAKSDPNHLRIYNKELNPVVEVNRYRKMWKYEQRGRSDARKKVRMLSDDIHQMKRLHDGRKNLLHSARQQRDQAYREKAVEKQTSKDMVKELAKKIHTMNQMVQGGEGFIEMPKYLELE